MLLRKFFEDKNGKLVVGQQPNLPILTWLTATLISLFWEGDTASKIAQLIAYGALFTWAWLEIFESTNSFRKVLGLLVLITIIYFQL